MEPEDDDDDDDSGGEQLYIKEDDDEEPIKEDSTDGNDTRLSDLHNTTIKTENDSEEDKPLVNKKLNFISITDILHIFLLMILLIYLVCEIRIVSEC